ncbi:MAG: OmpP1/FadL family transporter [Marinifilaceae bacterium]
MKKEIILTTIIGMLGITTYAQNEVDALRFARTQNLGTARSMAMGNAFTALGGDISSLGTNPAGLGVFRNSQVALTPSLNISGIKSGDTEQQYKNTFQLGNLGIVGAFYNPQFDWRGINVGVSYNNLNNFNRKGFQRMNNAPNSFLDMLSFQAGDIEPDKLDRYNAPAWMAYDTYLLNYNNEYGYYEPALYEGDLVNQSKRFEEKGYQGEYNISFATNYKDKFFIGATVGIQNIQYRYKSFYTESLEPGTDNDLNYYNYDEYLKINGTGVNFKMGMIYTPSSAFRIGVSVHTPTFYNMREVAKSDMFSQFNGPDVAAGRSYSDYSQSTDNLPGFGDYDYNYKTPWKANVGIASVLGSRLILSADYEFANYGKIRYSNASDNYDYGPMNSALGNLYSATHNLRAGAELRLSRYIALRAGYNYMQNPYKQSYATAQYIPNGRELQTISGGFGINAGRFYFDAAYAQRVGKENTSFYYYYDDYNDIEIEANPISNKFRDQTVRVTLGLRF